MNPQTLHTRREFLRTSVLGAAAAWSVPVFLEQTFLTLNAAAAEAATQVATGKDHPILVVLQLAGGNDGLNTVIPYADDTYYKARPTLGIEAAKVLKINDYLGLNPKLTGFKDLYDSGNMSIIQAVGYPNPNRSHFRSMEIWHTASDADKNEQYGWLGKYFDSCCSGEDPTVGVNIGGETPQAFTARTPTGVSFSNPERYRWMSGENGDESDLSEQFFRQLNGEEDSDGNAGATVGGISGANRGELGSVEFLQRTALDAQVSSDKIREIAQKYRSRITYPQGRLSESLSLVARMIAGGLPTRVYYVSQGGYDTHNNQANAHERLTAELSGSVKAFCDDLRQQGNLNRVLVLTFSEFGRRVEQNASNGTDHGAAAPMFLFGGAIQPGIHGKTPSLTDLYRGDIRFHVDFRSVYATVLDQWMKVESEKVLGRKWPNLRIV